MNKLEFWTRPNYETGVDETAVLYSTGYGAGWSTWNCTEIALDKRVVAHVMTNSNVYLNDGYDMECEYLGTEKDMKEFLASIGYDDVYCGGVTGLRMRWLPKGTAFRINEYDGAESIEILDMNTWLIA